MNVALWLVNGAKIWIFLCADSRLCLTSLHLFLSSFLQQKVSKLIYLILTYMWKANVSRSASQLDQILQLSAHTLYLPFNILLLSEDAFQIAQVRVRVLRFWAIIEPNESTVVLWEWLQCENRERCDSVSSVETWTPCMCTFICTFWRASCQKFPQTNLAAVTG